MTLSLEQVRQTRFHLARRNGYEPVDVDNFVDQVEVTLAQLGEENETLKKQVETLTAGGPAEAAPAADSAETEELRGRLSEADAELERLRGELESRGAELETARSALGESDQGELVTRLQGELDQAKGELAGRDERIAALSAELDGVRAELATAQAAQAERLSKVENIVVTAAPDAAPAVTKLLQMATEQAERLVEEADADAQRITAEASGKAESTVEEAAAQAHQALTDARARAEEIEQQAQAAADALQAETTAKSEALNTEITDRRTELFTALEAERDELRGKVDHLRSFEERYRQSLTSQLRAQLESLSAQAEPEDVPELLGEPAGPSATPRLDALLGDQN
ncbi:MAG: DivIVA domain-containing protein [Micropruina sp.]|uniref:DivIVA domain-containing protein n=1 Tax=Micropruina sp. TaxID=2737536 RepID=UPI0039E39DC8